MSGLWSDPVYGPLSKELHRRCGLVFEGGQGHLFRRRIERRAGELGYGGATEYVAALRTTLGESEYERLIERLTVNETYFFREEEHFQVLLDRLWSEWSLNGRGPIRVWSAACSTGCEPYTLAMLLLERGKVGPGRPSVEILGTDVNRRVLEEAARAEYGDFSLRNTPAYFVDKYFRKEGHVYRLAPEVRQMVTFRRFNLLNPDAGAIPRGFHGIFCRNVLIYFDLSAKRRAVTLLRDALVAGGALVVGRSESLFNVPEAPPLVSMGGIMIHRKR